MVVGVVVSELLEVVVASLVAGVGVTVLFSLVIYCATRAAELRQSQAPVLATLLGGIAMVGLFACIAVVVAGIHVMTQK